MGITKSQDHTFAKAHGSSSLVKCWSPPQIAFEFLGENHISAAYLMLIFVCIYT